MKKGKVVRAFAGFRFNYKPLKLGNLDLSDPIVLIKKTLEKVSRRSIPISVFSARNMRTYEGDIDKINQFTRPIAEKWLKDNGIDYSELILGKPWAGKEGWYVDDKNLSLEEFIFKLYYNSELL